MTSLTPYDTGEVLEPQFWIDAAQVAEIGMNYFEDQRIQFGKVDFDTDGGDTVTTIQIVRNDDADATEPYTIRIGGVPSDFAIEWVE